MVYKYINCLYLIIIICLLIFIIKGVNIFEKYEDKITSINDLIDDISTDDSVYIHKINKHKKKIGDFMDDDFDYRKNIE